MVKNLVSFLKGLDASGLASVATTLKLDANKNKAKLLLAVCLHLSKNPDDIKLVPNYAAVSEADDIAAIDEFCKVQTSIESVCSRATSPLPSPTQVLPPQISLPPPPKMSNLEDLAAKLVDVQLQQSRILTKLSSPQPARLPPVDDRFHKRCLSLGKLWNGERNENLSILEFLENLEELRTEYRVDDTTSFSCLRDILKGSAKEWFLANRTSFSSFATFKEQLLTVFLPFDYQRRLKNAIRNETQKQESMDLFLSKLSNMNRQLPLKDQFPEAELLELAVSNCRPCYTLQFQLLSTRTRSEIMRVARIIEHSQLYAEQFKAAPRASNARFLPRSASVESVIDTSDSSTVLSDEAGPSCISAVREPSARRQPQQYRCFRCNQPGHFINDCPLPPKSPPKTTSPVPQRTQIVRFKTSTATQTGPDHPPSVSRPQSEN